MEKVWRGLHPPTPNITAVHGVSVLVLLSCVVSNVLLAVTESVWWPAVAAVACWGAAAG